ncbi:GntR family transcriptional regulator [Roseomonas sp. 18066]|uniref:GntR family transcriptional regulator n=1 Tax=Roseomonas sp. 18066 TaxID=2681412 RepID=UPI001358D00A|nr:GntR family transcriptional regulator [Roseomonas sp. 18066]
MRAAAGRPSRSDRLADAISADIQAGVLAPGHWLKQVDLEEGYGATRNTVRNALLKLALQRFVVHAPNRGYRVPSMDPRRQREQRELRMILEAAMVPEMVRQATAAVIAELAVLATAFEALVAGGEFLRLIEANAAFHQRMHGLCRNTLLVAQVQEIRATMRPIPGSTWPSRARMEQSGREHRAMVEALAGGEVERLMRLVVDHIGKGAAAGVTMVRLHPPALPGEA